MNKKNSIPVTEPSKINRIRDGKTMTTLTKAESNSGYRHAELDRRKFEIFVEFYEPFTDEVLDEYEKND